MVTDVRWTLEVARSEAWGAFGYWGLAMPFPQGSEWEVVVA